MNNLRVKTDAGPVPQRQRVSERPGSIPCRLQDLNNPETIQRLRAVLNVEAYMRELRLIALQVIESELEP
jgi:hypothetical protein